MREINKLSGEINKLFAEIKKTSREINKIWREIKTICEGEEPMKYENGVSQLIE
jgi:peptidoglycan hydrolase CwlO-like protein